MAGIVTVLNWYSVDTIARHWWGITGMVVIVSPVGYYRQIEDILYNEPECVGSMVWLEGVDGIDGMQ